MPTCLVSTCVRKATRRSMCHVHYQRWQKYGHPLPDIPIRHRAPKHMTVLERFWIRIDTSGGPQACWPWQGSKNSDGYGRFGITQRHIIPAHVFAYDLTYGALLPGFEHDHLCHTSACQLGNNCPHRACCNPDHIAPNTHRENTMRGTPGLRHAVNRLQGTHSSALRAKARTHCRNGHPFTPQNTYLDKKGARSCKICRRAAHKQWRKNHLVS